MKRKSVSDSRSAENNSDKLFQKWVLFDQHRLMREPQTYLVIIQVHFRLSCAIMRQFSKICNGRQKVHHCGKFVYSSTWERFQVRKNIHVNGARAFMGHFLCSVETIGLQRFVNIRLHWYVRYLKKISKCQCCTFLAKIFADAHGYFHPFSKLWRIGKSGEANHVRNRKLNKNVLWRHNQVRSQGGRQSGQFPPNSESSTSNFQINQAFDV